MQGQGAASSTDSGFDGAPVGAGSLRRAIIVMP
jgi:hypothetical protein